MTFEELSFCPELARAIKDAGYTAPTPIQAQAIPAVFQGSDICASAQTGTGKTAAFVLPILNKLMRPAAKKGFGPRALILAPTRELAMQIAEEAGKYSKYMPHMKTVCIYGGAPYPIQNRQLSRPYEILVATPGRLIDHWERGRIDFSRTEIFVLDEADRMLDMGFIEPVEQIAEALPMPHQTLLFSATLKTQVLKLAKKLLNNPVEIHVTHAKEKHENIEQRLHFVRNIEDKYRVLDEVLEDKLIDQAIVFTATKRQTEQLSRMLEDRGHEVGALHGDMNQRQRTRTIGLMRQGKIRVLVATDVAARGIDVQTISYVVNFDIAGTAEDHVHRIGRTGRMNKKGVALSFAAPKDMHLVREIEKYTGQKMIPHKPVDEEMQTKNQGSFKKAPPGGSRGGFRSRQGQGRSFGRRQSFRGSR